MITRVEYSTTPHALIVYFFYDDCPEFDLSDTFYVTGAYMADIMNEIGREGNPENLLISIRDVCGLSIH